MHTNATVPRYTDKRVMYINKVEISVSHGISEIIEFRCSVHTTRYFVGPCFARTLEIHFKREDIEKKIKNCISGSSKMVELKTKTRMFQVSSQIRCKKRKY